MSKKQISDQSSARDFDKQKVALILAYKACGGKMSTALEETGVSAYAHRNWYTSDENYRREFERARLEVFPLVIQRCEQLSEDIISKVLEMGVDKAPKHLLNAALSEMQYKRSTLGKAEYSTKVINEVKVDESDKMTWEDVMAELERAAKRGKEEE